MQGGTQGGCQPPCRIVRQPVRQGGDHAVGPDQARATISQAEGRRERRIVRRVQPDIDRERRGQDGLVPRPDASGRHEREARADEVEGGSASRGVRAVQPDVRRPMARLGVEWAEVLQQAVVRPATALDHRQRDVAPADRPSLRLVGIEQVRAGLALYDGGQLPAQVVPVRDGRVHAPATPRRHPVRRVAHEERPARAPPCGDLGGEGERARGEQLHVEVRPSDDLADRRQHPVERVCRGDRGLVHARRQRDGEHVAVIGAARHDDRRRSARSGLADEVQPVAAFAKDIGQVRPEQDAQEAPEVVRSLHRDVQGTPDGTAVPVRADQPAGPDVHLGAVGPVADHGPDAVIVLLERHELGRERDPATDRPQVVDEDRLQVVLGADGGRRRADGEAGGRVREAERPLDRVRIIQTPDAGLARDDMPAAAAHRLVEAERPEDLHRAGADAGRPREDRRRWVAFDDERAHAVAGQLDGGDQPGWAGADHEDRGMDGASRGHGDVLLQISSYSVSDVGQSVR